MTEKAEDTAARRRVLFLMALEFAVYGAGFFAAENTARWIFTGLWLLAGFRVLRQAAANLFRGELFDENFLMSAATLGAMAIGAFSEAAGVMLFYRLGQFLEDYALGRSRQSITALLAIRPDYAELLRGDVFTRVMPEEARAGDTFRVRPGERIPLDGLVLEGSSWVDTSALTGEPVPRAAAAGDEVMGGSVNGNGMLTLKALRPYAESSAARILRLVEDAASRKSKTERFITRFARRYTPAVLALAVLTAVLPPLLFPDAAFRVWFFRALVLLVMSCPCALVVSIPLSYFGGLGAAARAGVLIKGSNFIDVLARVRTMVFDKTGTLTYGRFSVLKLRPAAPFSENELLELAARAEAGSNHPIALSLRRAWEAKNSGLLAGASSLEDVPGFGVRACLDGETVRAGNRDFLQNEGIEIPASEAPPPTGEEGVSVHVARGRAYRGSILIGDEPRPGAEKMIAALKAKGVRRCVMLSGDTPERARSLGRRVGMDETFGGLLPQDKFAALENIKRRQTGKTAYVGDGINDTPVLAGADVGIAMGGGGQDAALESADVVLLDDDLSKIVSAISVSERTRRIVTQNIVFALGIKLLFMTGGVAGIAGMWEAVFADVGVTVLAVLNAMRVFGKKA